MSSLLVNAVLLTAIVIASPPPVGSIASTTALQSSMNPATLSQVVTLTATVSPTGATGKVTFYDGVSLLGVGTLSGGRATLTTTLLPSGIRALRALYSGDPSYQSSISAGLSESVTALAQKGFQAAVVVGGLSFPRAIAVGDFNGDGIADVAVDDFDISKMSVLIGNGDGTFRAAVSYLTPAGPTDITVADFNGDGHPDIAVADGATPSNSVSIFLGRGDGTFQAAVNYAIADPNLLVNPNKLVVGDFNGDGVADIVTANFSDNSASLLLGNGDGTFRSPVKFSVGLNPVSIASADFNGDGATDLVLAANKTAIVLLGNGNGTFQTPLSYAAGSNPVFVAVGDLNGDGRADIIAMSSSDDIVNVLLGKGNGTFQPVVGYTVPKGVQAVAVGDFNGDGRPDIVVADSGSNNVNVLQGNGDGTFQPAVGYGPVSQPLFIAVGDFNSDGRSDLAVANFGSGAGISVLIGVPGTASPVINTVANAFGDTPLIAPNTWVEVKGTNLAPSTSNRIWADSDFINGQLPKELDGVSVTVNGKNAYLWYVSPAQLNILTPPDPLPGSVRVQLTNNGVTSNVMMVTAQSQSLSFFEVVSNNKHYVIGRHLDYTYVGPTTLFPDLSTPVKPGESIFIVATGFGPTDVDIVSGALTQTGNLPKPFPVIKVGGIQAAVTFAGLISVGTYQINFDVPITVPDGDLALTSTYNGLNIQPNLLLTVQH